MDSLIHAIARYQSGDTKTQAVPQNVQTPPVIRQLSHKELLTVAGDPLIRNTSD